MTAQSATKTASSKKLDKPKLGRYAVYWIIDVDAVDDQTAAEQGWTMMQEAASAGFSSLVVQDLSTQELVGFDMSSAEMLQPNSKRTASR